LNRSPYIKQTHNRVYLHCLVRNRNRPSAGKYLHYPLLGCKVQIARHQIQKAHNLYQGFLFWCFT